jgi:hypothetical protein
MQHDRYDGNLISGLQHTVARAERNSTDKGDILASVIGDMLDAEINAALVDARARAAMAMLQGDMDEARRWARVAGELASGEAK